MQVIFENKDKKGNGGGTNSMNTVLCTRRISGCVERKCIRGLGNERSRV